MTDVIPTPKNFEVNSDQEESNQAESNQAESNQAESNQAESNQEARALEIVENIRKASEGRVDVDGYFPEVNVFNRFEVQEGMTEKDHAFALWKNLLIAQQVHAQLFLVIGKMLKEFWKKELYIYLDYTSFGQFISSPEVSMSKETAYMYFRLYEFYVEKLNLNPETLTKMSVHKLSRMLPTVMAVEKQEGTSKAIERMYELNTLGRADLSEEVRQTEKDPKNRYRPFTTFNYETNLWQVRYYENKTEFVNAGVYEQTGY